MKGALRNGDYRLAAWEMSHFDAKEDAKPSDYFQNFEDLNNDRARTNIKLLNDSANAAGQKPLFGWWDDVDDKRPAN